MPHPHRYDNLRRIRSLDPDTDYHTIYHLTALHDFPFDTRMALLLAFWRTFAIPSIAELLAATGETTHRTARRADDTGILMYELIDHGLDHPRGRQATRRLNHIHRHYPITNDQHLYVLGTFIIISTRWIDTHGWRPLCCHERHAIHRFYTTLGQRMNIKHIPATLADYQQWFDTYEANHAAYTPAAHQLMTATKSLIGNLPTPLVPIGHRLADALLDEPLRTATGTPPPPRWARALLTTALRLRAAHLRHLASPRTTSSLADGLHPKTYPDGYDLTTIGPAATRLPRGVQVPPTADPGPSQPETEPDDHTTTGHPPTHQP